MSQSKVELEISQLDEQFNKLRLPHKLNQYRSFEKRLLALRTLTANIDGKSYETTLDRLQKKLDDSVLCGVGQCFLCAKNQCETAKVPQCDGSLSAGSRSGRYNVNTTNITSLMKTQGPFEVSYHYRVNPQSDDGLAKQTPPTPPASIHSEDGSFDQNVNIEKEANKIYNNPPVVNNTSAPLGDIHEIDSKSPNNHDHVENVNDTNEQLGYNHRDKLLNEETSDIQTLTNSESKSSSIPNNKESIVSGPLPFRNTSSYRTYKDFINNYSITRKQ